MLVSKGFLTVMSLYNKVGGTIGKAKKQTDNVTETLITHLVVTFQIDNKQYGLSFKALWPTCTYTIWLRASVNKLFKFAFLFVKLGWSNKMYKSLIGHKSRSSYNYKTNKNGHINKTIARHHLEDNGVFEASNACIRGKKLSRFKTWIKMGHGLIMKILLSFEWTFMKIYRKREFKSVKGV